MQTYTLHTYTAVGSDKHNKILHSATMKQTEGIIALLCGHSGHHYHYFFFLSWNDFVFFTKASHAAINENSSDNMLHELYLFVLCFLKSLSDWLIFLFRSSWAHRWCWILGLPSWSPSQQVSLHAFAQSGLARDEPEQRGFGTQHTWNPPFLNADAFALEFAWNIRVSVSLSINHDFFFSLHPRHH